MLTKITSVNSGVKSLISYACILLAIMFSSDLRKSSRGCGRCAVDENIIYASAASTQRKVYRNGLSHEIASLGRSNMKTMVRVHTVILIFHSKWKMTDGKWTPIFHFPFTMKNEK